MPAEQASAWAEHSGKAVLWIRILRGWVFSEASQFYPRVSWKGRARWLGAVTGGFDPGFR
jgi:hypothetical protein